jgi:hypothetical protein
MNTYIIMHNMIIGSECDAPVVDDQLYYHQGPLPKLIC